MCLIVFAHHMHEDYPLIIVANRDEFFHRPATPLHEWPGSSIIAGKDEEKGGTWMGVTKSGRFAAVTNVRAGKAKQGIRSRGEIVTGFLDTNDPASYLETCNVHNELYDGYNVIGGDAANIYYSTNQDHNAFHHVEPGIHGLSNARLNTPWPKVAKAKQALRDMLAPQPEQLSFPALFDLLTDTSEANEEDLPETGVDKDLERRLSPMFIRLPGYGTRSQTVLVYHKNGDINVEEKTFDESGSKVTQKHYQWNCFE
ncbi:Uncharacterized conserved protein, contains NRDE domain [Alteribacillus persepolensis]|uniref:Uncharacterized conserved protein, contains NRDE domain n=1 Tax=Alteribacillus persepolensis TaxID=568899 RepID=A0A1G7Z9Z7_9BACI|nr:NRDE family protein [Alteribacillus persepolensis]SDH05571.1 Uncharacterized conserved protein, contains NRDE domain [Alteribacillus persepolensis]